MSAATLLSIFALLVICWVQQTEAQAGQVCIVLEDNNVNEDMGPIVFELIRKGGSAGAVTVTYNLTNISTEDEDILGPRSGSVTFADGQTEATITVPINDDTIVEDTEQFLIFLSGDTGPVTLTTAIIFDNDIYSSWGEWAIGECGVTCGPANRTDTRTRTCEGPDPDRCEILTETRTVDCNLPDCPIITPWSEWTDVGDCSTTCGPGSQRQMRNRTCSGICPPEFTSSETRTVMCEICTCPVISMWSEWADNGICSTTCGPGTNTQMRTRSCTGSTCCPADFTSSETRTVMCEICTCPVISMWSEWAGGDCSTTCGPGTNTQMRTRSCTGSTCCPPDFTSSETRTATCEVCTCPVIGPWCPWSNTGLCSVTCGSGTQMQARSRTCVNTCTPPDCITREERTGTCYIACPTAWTAWNRWSGGSRWSRWSGRSRWNGWSGGSTWNRWSGGSAWSRGSGWTGRRYGFGGRYRFGR